MYTAYIVTVYIVSCSFYCLFCFPTPSKFKEVKQGLGGAKLLFICVFKTIA